MHNPFLKFMKEEDRLHNAICLYICTQHPKALFTHPANEGRRTPFDRFKIKYLHMKAGVPDLLIFAPTEKHCGLALEVKSSDGRLTENQKEWRQKLTDNGWLYCMVRTLDSGISVIDDYFAEKI